MDPNLARVLEALIQCFTICGVFLIFVLGAVAVFVLTVRIYLAWVERLNKNSSNNAGSRTVSSAHAWQNGTIEITNITYPHEEQYVAGNVVKHIYPDGLVVVFNRQGDFECMYYDQDTEGDKSAV